jgi:hypothetical protein
MVEVTEQVLIEEGQAAQTLHPGSPMIRQADDWASRGSGKQTSRRTED